MKAEILRETGNTILGMLAIAFWSTYIASSRSLMEELGTVTTVSYVHLAGGILGCLHLVARPKGLQKLLNTSIHYLVGCGVLFVAYMACLYLAVGYASTRQQVLEVGIINYLWPSLTLIFSIPILQKKARIYLLPGITLAAIGVLLAMAQNVSLSREGFMKDLRINHVPYILAFTASICWGLYSNLTRKWGKNISSGTVPIFLLGTGLIMMAAKSTHFQAEATRWTSRSTLEFLYVTIFPTLLAYVFWDTAMRKGNHTLTAALSYLTPLLSTAISSLYLQTKISPTLWIACILTVSGAIVCKLSLSDRINDS